MTEIVWLREDDRDDDYYIPNIFRGTCESSTLELQLYFAEGRDSSKFKVRHKDREIIIYDTHTHETLWYHFPDVLVLVVDFDKKSFNINELNLKYVKKVIIIGYNQTKQDVTKVLSQFECLVVYLSHFDGNQVTFNAEDIFNHI